MPLEFGSPDSPTVFANWLQDNAKSGEGATLTYYKLNRKKKALTTDVEARQQSSAKTVVGFAKDILKNKDVDEQVKAQIREHLLPCLVRMAGNDRAQLRDIVKLAGDLLDTKSKHLSADQRVVMATSFLKELKKADNSLRMVERRRWRPFSQASRDRASVAKVEQLTFKDPMVADLATAKDTLKDHSYGPGSFVVFPDPSFPGRFQALVRVPGVEVKDLSPIDIPAEALRSPAKFTIDGLWRQVLTVNGIAVAQQPRKDMPLLGPGAGNYSIVTQGLRQRPVALRYTPPSGETQQVALDGYKGSLFKKIQAALVEAKYNATKASARASESEGDRRIHPFASHSDFDRFIAGGGVGIVKVGEDPEQVILPRRSTTERAVFVQSLSSPMPKMGTANDVQMRELHQLGYVVTGTPTLADLGDKDFLVKQIEGVWWMYHKSGPDSSDLAMKKLDAGRSYFQQIHDGLKGR